MSSATAGCLSSGRVSQLGRVASVMVDAPPPQSVSDRLHGDCLKSWSCSSHWASPNALSLQSPGRAHCPSLTQSKSSPLKSHVTSSTGHPDKRALWGAMGRASCHHPGCHLHQAEALPGVQRLPYTWESPRPVGNKDQSGNAAPAHLSADSKRAPILGCSHSAILSPPGNAFLGESRNGHFQQTTHI